VTLAGSVTAAGFGDGLAAGFGLLVRPRWDCAVTGAVIATTTKKLASAAIHRMPASIFQPAHGTARWLPRAAGATW
jgi:hypothetical protein